MRSAPQRNPVHRFTVDRHLVETAVNASSLTREVSRPDLLLVGAPLHDIGKGQAGDHTEVGVRIVSELAPRLGFDAQDSAVLVDMVAYHLLLPDTATRRDLADPATAAAVAAAVKTPLVLELLDRLTRADAAATGPAAWSQWKASLVTELVGRTQAALDGRPEPARPALTPSQRELATGEGVQVLIEPGEGVWWVTVAADDRLGLLGQVAGALAVNRLAVRSARTETWAIERSRCGPCSRSLASRPPWICCERTFAWRCREGWTSTASFMLELPPPPRWYSATRARSVQVGC